MPAQHTRSAYGAKMATALTSNQASLFHTLIASGVLLCHHRISKLLTIIYTRSNFMIAAEINSGQVPWISTP